MTQLSLLSDSPIARRTDPVTSKQAAVIVTKGLRAAQQRKVLEMVKACPGLTSAELAERFNESRFLTARRLPEMRPEHVRNGEIRVCGVTGMRSLTWWAV